MTERWGGVAELFRDPGCSHGLRSPVWRLFADGGMTGARTSVRGDGAVADIKQDRMLVAE